MKGERDLTTPTERIAWAIEQVKATGVSLEQLAERVGCSHAALSQWQTGATNIENVKAGLLDRFCEETGVSPHWILHGGPNRVDTTTYSERVSTLAAKLRALEVRSPSSLYVVGKMIDAAADDDAAPPQ
jgi:transcriptional regulator with XRE-family HTH domain